MTVGRYAVTSRRPWFVCGMGCGARWAGLVAGRARGVLAVMVVAGLAGVGVTRLSAPATASFVSALRVGAVSPRAAAGALGDR